MKNPTFGLSDPPQFVTMSGLRNPAVLQLALIATSGVETASNTCVKSIPDTPVFLTQCTPVIAADVLDCKNTPQKYIAIDLSQTPVSVPGDGDLFKHVIIRTSQLPTGCNIPMGRMLRIFSPIANYLGPVATVQDITGLLTRKVLCHPDLMLSVLAIHTRLQNYQPFVARVFTLQYMTLPVVFESTFGMYTGERVGEWSLGSSTGVLLTPNENMHALCYHVTVCLLRAQILMTEVIGFPLSVIHPARVWRRGNAFSLDYISCLFDTFHFSYKKPPPPPKKKNTARQQITTVDPRATKTITIADGVQAVVNTLNSLGVFDRLPQNVYSMLLNINVNNNVFRDAYHLLTNVSVDADLRTILGTNDSVYEKITLQTNKYTVGPYGPFVLQIQNQYFKWNEAIIVEPNLGNMERVTGHISIKPNLDNLERVIGKGSVNTRKTPQKNNNIQQQQPNTGGDFTTTPCIPTPLSTVDAQPSTSKRKQQHPQSATHSQLEPYQYTTEDSIYSVYGELN